MKENKLVSIIIPTYKRADRLRKAIESALNQTYKKIEIIVIDDNNQNTEYRRTTEQIMLKYKDVKRVFYIQHERNKNGAAARNTGIRASKGELISFLDDDDLYLPEKTEKQVKYLNEHTEHNAVYCGRIQKHKQILGVLYGDLSQYILSLSFSPTMPALMFRSFVIKQGGGFDEQFRRHQDLELLLRYFKNNSIGVISEPLVEIGQNKGENELHGEMLDENKEAFLNLFMDDIEKIDMKIKGFKKKLYVAHYVPVFYDHLSQKEIVRSINIYVKGIKISFIKYNMGLIKYIFKYLRYLIIKSGDSNGVSNSANK